MRRLFRFGGFLTLLIILAGAAGAQEGRRYALGGGLEGSSFKFRDYAVGGSLSFDRGIKETTAAGVKLGVLYFPQRQDRISLAPEAFVRWYYYAFPLAAKGPLRGSALFAQWDLGVLLPLEASGVRPLFLGGLSLGWRFLPGSLFLEPFIRLAYPFHIALGISAGRKF